MQVTLPTERQRRFSTVKRRIGHRIRQARERHNAGNQPLSQEALAARLKIYPGRIWEIENGILGIDTQELADIARELGVHPGWFYGGYTWELGRLMGDVNKNHLNLLKSITELEADSRSLIENLVMLLSKKETASQAAGA